jgi:hypothetical protein
LKVIDPVRVPLVVGSKVTVTVHVPFAGSGLRQLFTTTKSAELVSTEAIVTGELPMFVTVRFCGGPDVPTYCGANERLVGLTDTVALGGVAGTPLPLRGTFIAPEVLWLFTIIIFAVRGPSAPGMNVTLTEQLAPTATLPRQLLV